MRPAPRLVLCLLLGTSVSVLGCKPKITLGELRKKNRPTIDAAHASFAEMDRVIGSAPDPAVNGPCVRPGLVPVVPISFGEVPAEERFGPAGSPDTELLDAAYLVKSEHTPPANGLFKSDGPVNHVANDIGSAKVPLDFQLEPVRAQGPYDAATKVRQMLVTRVHRSSALEEPERADVFLFEYPKGALVCSFAVDAAADRRFGKENDYDPHTGERVKVQTDDLLALFADALETRFGILYPAKPLHEKRLADDPKVRARAQAVSKALEAASAALPECNPVDAAAGVRLNKKGLRIVAGETLLGRLDANVSIDPTSSDAVMKYLRTRDRTGAGALVTADKWRVVDVTSGGSAASIDNKTFVGGSATGRQVTFDASNRPICQKAFRVAPPENLRAKVRTAPGGFASNDLRESSAIDLRNRIDEALGRP
jgi:hypothetical protein